MKYLLILFSALSLFTTVKSQDVNVLLQEAKKFEIALDENSAFNKYKEILNIQPTDLYALTRCSELAGSIGGREAKIKRQKYLRLQKPMLKQHSRLAPAMPGPMRRELLLPTDFLRSIPEKKGWNIYAT